MRSIFVLMISPYLQIPMQHGYAVIDLETLNPKEVKDICLVKFIALVLQVLLFCMFSSHTAGIFLSVVLDDLLMLKVTSVHLTKT